MKWTLNKFSLLIVFFFCTISLNLRSSNVPFFFIKNVGKYDGSYQYNLKSDKANILFGTNCILYQYIAHDKKKLNSNVENVAYSFVGSNALVKLNEKDQLTSKTNYLVGTDTSEWVRNINNFQTLEYEDLYKGIDLKYYAKNNQLKYDFIVKPGADPSLIKIEISGIQTIKKISDEILEIKTKTRKIQEKIPLAYQLIDGQRRRVKINYTLNGNQISYVVGSYDKNIELIIDPLMVYCTYVGGNADELLIFGTMEKDNAGNVYTAGYTASANFPTTPGSFEIAYNGGNYDAFVFKLNANGSGLVYSTFLGGNEFDRAYDILLEPATNNLYVAGVTWSPNFIVTAGAYQTIHASPTGGGGDAFVLKLNASGSNVIYSTLCGGVNDDMATSIEYNSAGNLVVAAQVQSADFPVTAGAYDVLHAGDYDGAVLIFDPTVSNLLASTFLGGSLREGITSLILDASDNIYVSSHTQGGTFPVTAGCLDNSYNGGIYDMALTKFNSNLSSVFYSTFIGGSGDDWIRNDLHVDASGNLLFSGAVSTGFPATVASYDPTYNGGAFDVFVGELNSTGSALNFGTFIGSSGDDGAYKLYKNTQNQIVVTGFCAQNYPTTPCCYDDSFNGGSSDAFISIFNSNASTLLYSTYVGGSGYDRGHSIICENDTAYVVGETSSSNFPVTAGAYDQSYNGGTADLMLFKLYLGFQPPVSAFTTTTLPCGLTLPFTNTSTNASTYLWQFGDGSTSNLVNPTHTYVAAGTYTVSLISNPGTSCSDTSFVVVNPGGNAPVSQFTYNVNVCSGTVSFTNTSANAVNYNWSFGDNNTSVQASPINTYINPGTYVVTLIAEAVQGCTDTATQSITISSPQPLAQFVYNTTACTGSVQLVNASQNAQSYQWNFGDGTPQETTSSPAHDYTLPGTYQIELIALNSLCSTDDTIQHMITIVAEPIATLINDTTLCNASNLNLNVNSGGNTVLWSTGSTNSSINVTQSGSYWVMLSNGYCSDRDTVNVNFFVRPDLGPDQTECSGTNIVLQSHVQGAQQWSTGAGTSSIIVNTSGIYWVQTSSGTCNARDSVSIVFMLPPNLNLGNDTSLCNVNDPAPILLNAGTGSGLTYEWSTGAVTSSILASQVGVYWVEVNNAVCTVSDTITISRYSGIELGDDKLLCGLEEIKLQPKTPRDIPSAYLWSTGETLPVITVQTAGSYWVEVTQGQCVFIDSIKVNGSINDGALFVPNSFTPGPDYVNDVFYAEGESIIDFKMMIFNRWGEKVFESNDISQGWDGIYKGHPVQVDTYVWIVDYATHCNDETHIRKKGIVNVLR